MTAPTIEVLMSTRPCVRYPRARVERVLAACGHPQTWEALAIALRDRGWRNPGDTGVSLFDLMPTAFRAATRAQRQLCVVRATHLRVEAQTRRWPRVSSVVADVRRRLLAWRGDEAEILAIRDAAAVVDAYDVYAAVADAAAAVADADADADAAYDAAYAAYAASAWDSLLYVCRLLDGTEVTT